MMTPEERAAEDARWAAGASQRERAEAARLLSETDKGMARAVEDLIGVLLSKQVISGEELPSETIQKISERATLRQRLKG